MPPRQMTFPVDDREFTIEEHSEKILLSGLSFDHIILKDGYIQPCVEPTGESQYGLNNHDEATSNTPRVVPFDVEDVKVHSQPSAVEVLPNEQTEACSDGDDHSHQIDSTLPTSSSLKARSGKLNVERCLKKVIRLFRKSLKRQFDDVYNKKHYYWNHLNLRKKTLAFFTEMDTPVSADFYLKNEEAFFKLVHNTFDDQKSTLEGMQACAVSKLFKDVFGQHPNKKNLMSFFSD